MLKKYEKYPNKQADAVPEVCMCKFVAVGEPLDGKGCSIHGTKKYSCPERNCLDYRPKAPKLSPKHWPRCVCGEIAQEHN